MGLMPLIHLRLHQPSLCPPVLPLSQVRCLWPHPRLYLHLLLHQPERLRW